VRGIALGLGVALIAITAIRFRAQTDRMAERLAGQDDRLEVALTKLTTMETALSRLSRTSSHEGTAASGDALRLVVREELSELQCQQRADTRAAAPAAARPTEENVAALVSGDRLVDEIVTDGVWDDQHVEQLRGFLRAMTPGDSERTRLKLIVAINEGRVRVPAPAVPTF